MVAPTFLQVLAAEVARMQALYPDREGELARANALILHGLVVPSPDDPQTGQVLSSDAQTVYRVNGTCDCQAGQHGKMCKHRQAWGLYRYIIGKVPMSTPEGLIPNDTPPQPLYEAPASANVHLTIDGRQVQLTLRDRDEGRLLERLQAVLAQYPVDGNSHTPTPGPDLCPLHPVAMQTNQKDGRTWHSHKTADGWCKGK